jgi:hypothetical protein
MPEEDRATNGATNGAAASRLRRPALERSEPRRGWGNLYAPGKADAAANHAPQPAGDETPHSQTQAREPVGAPIDAAARVVRDGYRVVEENLRRGRQVAAELRGVRREVADFAGRIDAQRLVSEFTQTVIDPALTQQMVGVAKTLLGALGAVVPAAAAATGVAPPTSPSPAGGTATKPDVALHPQARPDYTPAGARVLKLREIAPGEWLADMEIDGQVRRVQVRAVDGEL